MGNSGPSAVMIVDANAIQSKIATLTTIAAKIGLDVNVIGLSGGKSNNGQVPDATYIGVLPAVANAANPGFAEGNQVALSVDLSGRLRVQGSDVKSTLAAVNIAVAAGTTIYTCPAGKYFRGAVYFNSNASALTAGSTVCILIAGARVKGVSVPATLANVSVMEALYVAVNAGQSIVCQVTLAGGTGNIVAACFGVEYDVKT